MTVDTNALVAMTEANQNFSKVVHMVDETGLAVILKNNKPKYVVVNFEEYDRIGLAMQMRERMIETATDELLTENMDALRELAK